MTYSIRKVNGVHSVWQVYRKHDGFVRSVVGTKAEAEALAKRFNDAED